MTSYRIEKKAMDRKIAAQQSSQDHTMLKGDLHVEDNDREASLSNTSVDVKPTAARGACVKNISNPKTPNNSCQISPRGGSRTWSSKLSWLVGSMLNVEAGQRPDQEGKAIIII